MPQEDKWIGSWYDQADRLQAIENSHGLEDIDLKFNMPTIICLGEESSGKSSTMERLASFKFFPTDRKLCTRLPIKLCIRYCPEEELEEDFRVRGKVMMKLRRAPNSDLEDMQGGPFQPSQVEEKVRDWMNQIVRENNDDNLVGVCEDTIIIKLFSQRKMNLDLVDLPGIVGGNIKNEPSDMMEKTRKIASSYLEKDHTIVVAVVPGTDQRIRNSQAMELVQRHHKEGHCIGAITMVDLAEDRRKPDNPFWLLKERLEGTADDLPELNHGYVALKNRDSSSENIDQSLDVVNIEEKVWLDKHLIEHRDYCGIEALITKLVAIIDNYTSDVWIHAELDRLRFLRSRDSLVLASLGSLPDSLHQIINFHKDHFVMEELKYTDVMDMCAMHCQTAAVGIGSTFPTPWMLLYDRNNHMTGAAAVPVSHVSHIPSTHDPQSFSTSCWNRALVDLTGPNVGKEISAKLPSTLPAGALLFIGYYCQVNGSGPPRLRGYFTTLELVYPIEMNGRKTPDVSREYPFDSLLRDLKKEPNQSLDASDFAIGKTAQKDEYSPAPSQAPVFGVPTGGFQAGLPGDGARRKVKAVLKSERKKNTPPTPPSASGESAYPQSSQPPLQSGSSNYGGFGQTTPAAGTPSEAFGAVKRTPPEFGFGNAAGRMFGGAAPTFPPRVSPQQGFTFGAAPMSKQPSISVAGVKADADAPVFGLVILYRKTVYKLDVSIPSKSESQNEYYSETSNWKRRIRDIGCAAVSDVTARIVADAKSRIKAIDPRFEKLHLAMEAVLNAWREKSVVSFSKTWEDHCRSLVITPEYLQEALSCSTEIRIHSYENLLTPNGLTITLSEMLYSELSMNRIDDLLFPALIGQVVERLISHGFSESELCEENCAGQRKLLNSKIAALDTMIEALHEIGCVYSSPVGSASSPIDTAVPLPDENPASQTHDCEANSSVGLTEGHDTD